MIRNRGLHGPLATPTIGKRPVKLCCASLEAIARGSARCGPIHTAKGHHEAASKTETRRWQRQLGFCLCMCQMAAIAAAAWLFVRFERGLCPKRARPRVVSGDPLFIRPGIRPPPKQLHKRLRSCSCCTRPVTQMVRRPSSWQTSPDACPRVQRRKRHTRCSQVRARATRGCCPFQPAASKR